MGVTSRGTGQGATPGALWIEAHCTAETERCHEVRSAAPKAKAKGRSKALGRPTVLARPKAKANRRAKAA